jgi:hypothetical protein
MHEHLHPVCTFVDERDMHDELVPHRIH